MALPICLVRGVQQTAPLSAYYQAVVDWLVQEGFCDDYDKHTAPISVGYVQLSKGGVNNTWHLRYDLDEQKIVLAKVEQRRGAYPANFPPPQRTIKYICRFFECDLGDPNLWDKTVCVLRAFRYSYWQQ